MSHAYLLYEHSDEPDDALHGIRYDFHEYRKCTSVSQRSLNEEERHCITRKIRVMKSQTEAFALSMLTFRYSASAEVPVLDDINLSIASGETIGIVGGTGSVKISSGQPDQPSLRCQRRRQCYGSEAKTSAATIWIRCEMRCPSFCRQNVLFSGSILDNLRWGDPNATEEQCIRSLQTGVCR